MPRPARNATFFNWRNLGRLWAALLGVAGSAAAALQVAGPPAPPRRLPADTAVTAAEPAEEPAQPSGAASVGNTTELEPKNSSPMQSFPTTLLPSDSRPLETAAQTGHTLPKPLSSAALAGPANPKARQEPAPNKPPESKAPQPDRTTVVPGVNTPKPLLVIHYSRGSSLAKAEAQRLAAQLGSTFQGSNLDAQVEIPNAAIVKFSEPRNHAFALATGKSLANLGYSWRIDNAYSSGSSQLGVVEVWMPAK